MDDDILYKSAVNYQTMLNIGYKIVLGRKGKPYYIDLNFYMESFFHLIGLQHLTDLEQLKGNKERIYKEILAKITTYEDIKKSIHFEEWKIKERITYLDYLEEMLDKNEITFLINSKEYVKYTKIKADYLFEYLLSSDTTLYFFSVKDSFSKIPNECVGCSFFKRGLRDYKTGTIPTTLLCNEKVRYINKRDIADSAVLYQHPKYVISS